MFILDKIASKIYSDNSKKFVFVSRVLLMRFLFFMSLYKVIDSTVWLRKEIIIIFT